MSFLRWLGREYWRGPIGTVDHRPPARRTRSLPEAVVRAGLAGVVVAALVFLTRNVVSTSREVWVAVAFFAMYGTIAYWTDSRPASDNVGFVGGLIDRPFRVSDDYNRLLIGIAIIMWPGRFVIGAARDLVTEVRRAWRAPAQP